MVVVFICVYTLPGIQRAKDCRRLCRVAATIEVSYHRGQRVVAFPEMLTPRWSRYTDCQIPKALQEQLIDQMLPNTSEKVIEHMFKKKNIYIKWFS